MLVKFIRRVAEVWAQRAACAMSVATLATLVSMAGCSSVPTEVVQLSSRVGNDIDSLRASYVALVHAHFEAMREARVSYVENEWAPVFIGKFVQDGRLIDVAKGQVVWSSTEVKFVPPIADRAQVELLDTVRFWSESAVRAIDKKKRALVDPLEQQERELLGQVNEAFDQISRGNAIITAHLNSLRKVQEAQDQALAALDVKDLRDKINNTLIKASDEADDALDAIKKADGLVDKITAIPTTVMGSTPGGTQ